MAEVQHQGNEGLHHLVNESENSDGTQRMMDISYLWLMGEHKRLQPEYHYKNLTLDGMGK